MAIEEFDLDSDSITNRVVNPKKEINRNLDRALRPTKLTEYIGQDEVCDLLKISIVAAQQRKETLDHILIFGPPGLGKTTLAGIIANEMNVNLITTSGPVLEKSVDIASILSGLQPNDILFIDEIHRLPPKVEETLYSAMEDYHIDIMLGEGAGASSMRYPIPPFTLVGATTRAGSLTSPLLARFGHNFRLKFYNVEDLSVIVTASIRKLGGDIDYLAAREIALRARGTPRLANNCVRWVRDYAQVKANGKMSQQIVSDALDKKGIDKNGLDFWDRKLLNLLVNNFKNHTAGLDTLAAALGEDALTIEDVIEPYLIQQGYINRTPRGRVATEKAINYVNSIEFDPYNNI